MTIKLGNKHLEAETKAMKEMGYTSRIKFRRERFKAEKNIEDFKKNFNDLKTMLNGLVADLLAMNSIEHGYFEERIKDGVFILDHYIIAPQEVVNTIKACYDILISEYEISLSGFVEVKFHSEHLN